MNTSDSSTGPPDTLTNRAQPHLSEPAHETLQADVRHLHYIHNTSLLAQETLPSTARQLAAEISALVEAGKYREAAVRFSTAIPITPATDATNEKWSPVAHYNLGMLYALANDYQSARQHMELSGLPIGGHHNNLLFQQRFSIAWGNVDMQERARARGTPSIFITALPKSASTFVSGTLARLLSASVVTVSFECSTRAVSGLVVERWARQVARGGAVTHEHYSAEFGNLACLVRAGIRKIFVQVRDPRAAHWSFFCQRAARSDVIPNAGLMRITEQRYPATVAWIKSWLDAKADPGAPEIEFVHYDDVRTDPAPTITRILRGAGSSITEQAVRAHLDADVAAGRKPDNFRSGDIDEWRRLMPAELKTWLWEKTLPEVKEFLTMEP